MICSLYFECCGITISFSGLERYFPHGRGSSGAIVFYDYDVWSHFLISYLLHHLGLADDFISSTNFRALCRSTVKGEIYLEAVFGSFATSLVLVFLRFGHDEQRCALCVDARLSGFRMCGQLLSAMSFFCIALFILNKYLADTIFAVYFVFYY